jgi:hypothetical protein
VARQKTPNNSKIHLVSQKSFGIHNLTHMGFIVVCSCEATNFLIFIVRPKTRLCRRTGSQILEKNELTIRNKLVKSRIGKIVLVLVAITTSPGFGSMTGSSKPDIGKFPVGKSRDPGSPK